MSLPRHFHATFHRRRPKLRRRLAIALGVIVLLIVGTGYWLTRPRRLAAMTGGMLERLSGAKVHIDSATFTLQGAVELRGVRLDVPGLSSGEARVFDAAQAMIQIDPWALLRGRFEARQILLVQPRLWLTEIGDDEFNFSVLQKLRRHQAGRIPRLPRVYVQRGELRFGEVHEHRYQAVGAMDVAGVLNPDATHPGRYAYELYRYNPDQPSKVVGDALAGRFDLNNLSVEANLSDFAFANPHRNMLPRQMREWWDRLQPSGSLQDIRFDYDPKTGPHAEVHIRGVSLTLPPLSHGQFRARMTDVSGVLKFGADHIRIDNLVGRIEDLTYRINGTIDGYAKDASFRLAVETRPLRIRDAPRYQIALPPKVQKIFQILSPVGWLRVSIDLKREEPGGPIQYAGMAKILSGERLLAELTPEEAKGLTAADLDSHGHYEHFPYELHHCYGLISFDSQKLEIRNLTGDTGGGGSVTITGLVRPPGPGAEADITITAVDLPLDEKLEKALPPSSERAMRAFFDPDQYKRLHDAGFFVTSEERATQEKIRTQLREQTRDAQLRGQPTTVLDAQLAALRVVMKRPVFNLGGKGNAIVKVHRDPGPNKPLVVHTELQLTDANVVFKLLPYPVRVSAGKLVIDHDHVRFEKVAATGLHGGHGGLDGTVDYAGEGAARRPVPALTLDAHAMPTDDLLLQSLGEFRAGYVRKIGLAGAIDVTTKIFDTPRGIDFSADIDLAHATATPEGSGFTLDHLAGHVVTTLTTLKMRDITAKRGEGTLSLDADAEWSDAKHPTGRLKIAGQRVALEPALMQLAGSLSGSGGESGSLLSSRAPRGEVDARVDFAIDRSGRSAVSIEAEPHWLEFTQRGGRVRLDKMSGSVGYDGSRVTLTKLAGSFEGGRLSVNGAVTLGTEPVADLSLSVEGSSMTPTLLRLMPEKLATAAESMKLSGRYKLTADRLVVRPRAKKGRWLDTKLTLNLADASAVVSEPIRDVSAKVILDAEMEVGRAVPALRARIEAKRLRVRNRLLEDVAVELHDGGKTDPDAILVTKLEGRCAGGGLEGSGGMNFTTGRYTVRLALSDADIGPLLQQNVPVKVETGKGDGAAGLLNHPVEAAAGSVEAAASIVLPEAKPKPISGRVSGSLSLAGRWGDRGSLRGRGELMVRGGELYGVPLAFGLFRITHLALPIASPFDSALVSYYVRKDRVVLEHIQLDSPSMRLSGGGAMRISTGAIEMILTTSNPRGLDLGPITELLAKFRNQLLSLHVTGTVTHPRVKAESFAGIGRAWDDVFKSDESE